MLVIALQIVNIKGKKKTKKGIFDTNWRSITGTPHQNPAAKHGDEPVIGTVELRFFGEDIYIEDTVTHQADLSKVLFSDPDGKGSKDKQDFTPVLPAQDSYGLAIMPSLRVE
jgi:hypothetical protein